MNIVDYFSEKQKANIPEDAIRPFQEMLTANINPLFQSNLASQIDNLLQRTGSNVLIPMGNTPALCREAIVRAQDLRDDDVLFLPIIHNVFGRAPNPGDPVIFCIVSNTIAGFSFEWDHFHDLLRREKITLMHTTREDLPLFHSHITRELQNLRKKYAKERKRRVKQKS